MIKRFLFIGLAIFTTHTEVEAQGQWQFTNGPFYSDIRDLAIDLQHPDTLIVATAIGTGLYKSINGGENWITMRNDSSQKKFYALAMVTDDPNTIYAGGAPGIYKTVNQGLNWNKLDLNEGVWSLAIDPSNSDIVYAGTMFSGLFQSTDGGSTWVAVNVGLPVDTIMGLWIKTIAVDPMNSEVIYVGTSTDGLYKSVNSGSSFDYLTFDNGFIYDLVIDPHNSDIVYVATGVGLYKSLNGGLNWDRVFIQSIRSVDIDPNNSQILYCGTAWDGVFLSTNGGLNWTEISNGLSWPLATRVWVVRINPQNSNMVYIGTGIGVYKSIDESYNWLLKNVGFSKGASILSVAEEDSEVIIYAGGTAGIFKSTDDGQNWNYAGLYASISLVVDKNNPTLLFSAVLGIDVSSHLFRSLDGGVNWEYTGLSSATGIKAIAIDPFNSNLVYAGGFAKSYNGGDDWDIHEGPKSYVNCISIATQNTQILYAGTLNGVYKSTNEGINWDFSGMANKNVLAIVLDPLDSNVVYAGVWEEGIFKSTDAGSSWFEINDGLTNLNVQSLIIHPDQTDQLYAGTSGGGVFESSNGGMSWSEMNEGLDNLTVGGLDFDPIDPGKIYAATERGVYIYTEPTGIKANPTNELPSSFILFQNYPNPFNAQTRIRFQIPYDSPVILTIYDVLGREVATLVKEYLHRGEYTVSWNGRDNSGKLTNSGLYFCHLRIGKLKKTRKIVLLR